MKFTRNLTGAAKCRLRAAFSRIDVLATTAALLLLALAVAPAAVSHRSDAGRQVCANNLRLISRAVQMWAADHTQQMPWRTPQSDGGLMPPAGSSRPGAAWFDFVSLSNELVSPKVLACPADAGVLRANTFNGEFITVPFRGNAVSYTINLDSSLDVPRVWLSSDRNLNASSISACSARVMNVVAIQTASGFIPRWTNAVHGLAGHVATTDGSVEFTSAARLSEVILSPRFDDNGSIHFLRPR